MLAPAAAHQSAAGSRVRVAATRRARVLRGRTVRSLASLASASLLALAGACALAPCSAGAAAPGVVINTPYGLTPQVGPYVGALGVPWVRSFVPWSSYEPTRGTLSPGIVGALEAGIASLPAGTHVDLDVLDSPEWASGSTNPATPPRNPSDYAAFLSKLAKRLGGRVAAWEIWNEEDDQSFWSTGPNAAQYTALLHAAYKAIKRVDRSATVLVGGLTGNDYEFLEALYKHGAKGSFDAVAVHTDDACDVESPYEYEYTGRFTGRISRWSFLGYRTVHAVMLANHDPKPIWMTELGWSTYPGTCSNGMWAGQKPGGVSPEVQATFLRQAYHCLAQNSYVPVAIWYGLQDPLGSPGDFGLLEQALQPKPAFATLSAYARAGDTLDEPCGDFHGPTITIAHPTKAAHLRGGLTVVLSASDPFGVERITLETDRHHHVRTFTTRPAKATFKVRWWWWDLGKLRPGRHVLHVLAVDERGNFSTRSIVFWKTAGSGH
jgi:hypothetical protein